MEFSEIISLLVGIIGTGIAVYQTAVINESKKRKNELQFLLAGVNAVAIQKQSAWQNQISLLTKPETPEQFQLARMAVRARDEAAEIANLTSALEGTINTENSAIVAMLEKNKEIMEKSRSKDPSTEFKNKEKAA